MSRRCLSFLPCLCGSVVAAAPSSRQHAGRLMKRSNPNEKTALLPQPRCHCFCASSSCRGCLEYQPQQLAEHRGEGRTACRDANFAKFGRRGCKSSVTVCGQGAAMSNQLYGWRAHPWGLSITHEPNSTCYLGSNTSHLSILLVRR